MCFIYLSVHCQNQNNSQLVLCVVTFRGNDIFILHRNGTDRDWGQDQWVLIYIMQKCSHSSKTGTGTRTHCLLPYQSQCLCCPQFHPVWINHNSRSVITISVALHSVSSAYLFPSVYPFSSRVGPLYSQWS